MCLTTVGRVVSIEDGAAVVELDGRHRRALSLLVPDVQPGDLVLVGLGAILGRVDPADQVALHRIRNGTVGSRPSQPQQEPIT
jgi:hydrogenase maturation factor